MKKLNKSDTVLCPECSAEIAELAQDIKESNSIAITSFNFKPGHPLKDGTPRCKDCGAQWLMYGNKLKTKNKGIMP